MEKHVSDVQHMPIQKGLAMFHNESSSVQERAQTSVESVQTEFNFISFHICCVFLIAFISINSSVELLVIRWITPWGLFFYGDCQGIPVPKIGYKAIKLDRALL